SLSFSHRAGGTGQRAVRPTSRRWEQAPPHDTDYGGGTGGHGRRRRPSPAWIRRWLPSPAPIRWRRPSPAWIRRPVPSPTLIRRLWPSRCLLTVTGGGRRRQWLRRLKDDGEPVVGVFFDFWNFYFFHDFSFSLAVARAAYLVLSFIIRFILKY
ncbi:Os09g0433400, partial [Oryza sativa Japonica Group]